MDPYNDCTTEEEYVLHHTEYKNVPNVQHTAQQQNNNNLTVIKQQQ